MEGGVFCFLSPLSLPTWQASNVSKRQNKIIVRIFHRTAGAATAAGRATPPQSWRRTGCGWGRASSGDARRRRDAGRLPSPVVGRPRPPHHNRRSHSRRGHPPLNRHHHRRRHGVILGGVRLRRPRCARTAAPRQPPLDCFTLRGCRASDVLRREGVVRSSRGVAPRVRRLHRRLVRAVRPVGSHSLPGVGLFTLSEPY
jgi:hypothetical protein